MDSNTKSELPFLLRLLEQEQRVLEKTTQMVEFYQSKLKQLYVH